jgi:hypothetical protein
MLRRLVVSLVALAALTLAPAAVADGGGPSPGLMDGWTGVTTVRTPLRFISLPFGRGTMIVATQKNGGRAVVWRQLRGHWGVSMVAADGTTGGLSRDGRLLVLAEWSPPRNGLRPISRFMLLNAKTLGVWRTLTLRGDFAFDALSPGGRTLYLIKHVPGKDLSRYQVRAYDFATSRLEPRVIADRRQASWVMRGYPLRRVTNGAGRWVYTLYQQNGGYPFIHALDAVNRTAVCIGIPWTGSQKYLWAARLRLDERNGKLTVTGAGKHQYAVDTTNFRVSLPSHASGGPPTTLVAGLGSGATVLTALGALALRRRFRPRPDDVA